MSPNSLQSGHGAIALLVLRAVTHQLISDASYGGLGGWSKTEIQSLPERRENGGD